MGLQKQIFSLVMVFRRFLWILDPLKTKKNHQRHVTYHLDELFVKILKWQIENWEMNGTQFNYKIFLQKNHFSNWKITFDARIEWLGRHWIAKLQYFPKNASNTNPPLICNDVECFIKLHRALYMWQVRTSDLNTQLWLYVIITL